jgi:polysaccharide export outer membrane protein
MPFPSRPAAVVCTRLIAGLAAAATCLAVGPIAASAETVARASGTSTSIGREAFRYRLGPGDSLAMSVFKMNGYEAKVEVLSDGTINLPRIGTIGVWGLTLEEARQRITAAYEVFLRRPIVYLDLVNSRPVKVTVTGEVERPGVFSLPTQSAAGWPTLVDVVQKAGGVTASGDLSRIEVLRPSARPGGPMQRYQFDYLTVLREGGHAPNPLIYDGDSVRLYQSESFDNADLITTAASNFAPDTIRVNVIGEVAKPGIQQVPSNAPLSQAIFASGGITRRGSISTVELVRVDGDGEPTVTVMSFDPSAVLSSPTNPPLRQNDVIVVNRSTLARVTDGLTDAFSPLTPIVNAASIFRILGLPTGLN